MVCSVLGNVKPGLSALENEAVDARAVMHLVSPEGLQSRALLCVLWTWVWKPPLYLLHCSPWHGHLVL